MSAAHTCVECGIAAHALKKCGQCFKVQYCSETCQKKAWKTHKTTCGITPAMKPITPTAMVRNSAGGASYVVTDWTRLMRFIFLGAEGPTYYTSGKELFHGNAVAIKRLLTTDGPKVVQLVEDISVKGDAAKQDNLVCARHGRPFRERADASSGLWKIKQDLPDSDPLVYFSEFFNPND